MRARDDRSTAMPEEHRDFMAGQDPLDVEAASWLVRRQDGLSAEEEAEFQAWLQAQPEHAAAWEGLSDVWGGLDDVPADEVDKLRVGLRDAEPAPARAPRQRQKADAGRRSWLAWPVWPQAALACACMLVAGAAWLGWQARDGQLLYQASLTTQVGELQTIALPDGSSLVLDTATQATIMLYERRREVVLTQGQAFFVVQADAERPFDVHAGDVQVRVTGTRFGVRATQTGLEAGKVSVAVEQGSVRVRRDSLWPQWLPFGDAGQPLRAGQFVVAGAQGALVPELQQGSDNRQAWRERRVSFIATPLSQAMGEFQRYGHGGIELLGTAGQLRVTGSFDLDRMDAFLQALPQVLPVRVIETDGHLRISRRDGR